MKKTNKTVTKILIALMTIFTLNSCDSMLDIDSKDNVDSEHIYKSVKNFEYGVIGTYANLHLEYNLLIGSILADECKLAPENNGVDGFAVNLHRWTFTSEDDVILEIWKNYYNHIYSINTLLENAYKVPIETSDERETLDSLVAELYGLRALIHFELHRIFGASDSQTKDAETIPYITIPNILAKPGKITLQEYYNHLWEDLEKTKDLDINSITRLNPEAITALQARIALYQKDYASAVQYSSAIIQTKALSNINTYTAIWEDTASEEVLFKLKRNADDDIRPNTLWYNYATGKTLFYASEKLRNTFQDNDIRYDAFFSKKDDKYIAKYGGSDNRINDYKVFRVSEMYLIRAEAQLKLGQENNALNDLNILRQHRIQNNKDLISIDLQAIATERVLEFPFEGHRYFDLKRLGIPLERNKEDLVNSQDQQVLTIEDENYLVPIPHKEIQSNPNLK